MTYFINQIEILELFLVLQYPEAIISLRNKPRNPLGHYFLDFLYNEQYIVIEWFGKKNYFGVSLLTEDTGYGEKPDNVFCDMTHVLNEIDRLLNQR